MAWVEVDQYHAKNGSWTMTKNGKEELGNLKFALFENGNFKAVCSTQKEAVEKHRELTK